MAERIAMLHPAGWIPSSGGEKNVAAIMQALHRDGMEVHAVCRPGPLAGHLQQMGLHAQAFFAWNVYEAGRAAYLNAAARLYQAISAPQPQPAEVFVRLLAELRPLCFPDALRASLPRPITPVEETDLLRPHESRPLGGTLELTLPLEALRLQHALHGLQADVIFCDLSVDAVTMMVALQGTQAIPVWYAQMTETEVLTDPILRVYRPRIITCGAGVKATRFADAADVTVIANGIDTQLFKPRSEGVPRPTFFAAAAPRDFLLVYVGSVIPRKGCMRLLEACRLVNLSGLPFHLYLVGAQAESYARALHRKALDLGLASQLHMPGPVEQIDTILPHADVFILPSLVEGLPLALCEAMACGVPCIASDLPGCREVAADRSALLVLPDTPTALAAAILRVCRSPGLRQSLAQRGRARVEQAFDRRVMMQQFCSTLRALGSS